MRTYGVCAINRTMYDAPCPSLWGLNCVNYTTDNCHIFFLFWTVRFDKGMVLIVGGYTCTVNHYYFWTVRFDKGMVLIAGGYTCTVNHYYLR